MIYHGETRPNEVFIFNAKTLDDLKCLEGLTYRIGERAYEGVCNLIEDERPVFVLNKGAESNALFYSRILRQVHLKQIELSAEKK